MKLSAYLTLLAASLLGAPAAAQPQNWTVQAGETGCLLVTPQVTVNDGQGDTSVRIELDQRRLRVLTRSNIDAEFGDLGLTVDDRAFIPADTLDGETSVLFEKRLAEIVEQFIAGHSVRVQLRFWPTWPTTGSKSADFSLIGFTRAYRAIDSCE